MAEAKPSIKVWPMTGQLQKGQSKTLDIILENGATDYDVEIVSTTKLQYDKAQKRLTSKAAGGVGDGIIAKFTPKKDAVLGDPVTISVDIIKGQAAADKPVLRIVEGQDHEMQVSSEKPITIQVQPSNATYTFVNKRADVVEFIKDGSKLKTKTTVTAGTSHEQAYVEFTPKIGEDVVGEMVYAAVKTVAAPSQPATELTLSAESGNVDINGKVLVDVTTNATEFRVESKNTDKATVRTTKTVTGGKGQFEITGKAAGEARIEVKATKSGASETMKVYTATVQEAAPKPSLTVEPQQVTIKQDATQVLTINLANGAADFDVAINQQEKIGFDKGSKTITGKQVTSDGTITLTPKKDATLGDPVVVNVVVQAKDQLQKPTMTIDPMTVDLKVNETKVLNITGPEGGDYEVNVKNQDKVGFDKASKTITAKAVHQGAKIGFTPVKDTVRGDEIEVTVNVAAADQPTKPSLTVTPNPVAIKVEGTQVLTINLENGATDYDFEVKNQDKFGYDKASKTITAKAEHQGAILELTPKKEQTLGDKVQVTINIAAKDSGGDGSGETVTTNLTLSSESGKVEIGKTLDVNVTTNATDFTVTSKAEDKATVAKSQGKFTITGKAAGSAVIEVKATAAGGSEVKKEFNVTVEAAKPIDPPAPETVFSVSPQVVTIANKQKQVFTLANEGDSLKVECNPADAIEWNADEKAITAKRTGQFAVKFIKSESEVITVNLTVSPEPSVWDKFQNIADVKALLAKGDVTPKDKFDQLDNSVSQYGSLVQSLSTYNAKMGPSVPNILPKNGAGQNYNLLNQIMYVVELSNKEDFTVQFDIINLYFKEYKNEAYKEHSMQRFDNYWIWDTKALNTWMNLVTCICSLCDIATRQENLKKISLDKVLDPTTTLFSPTAIANIKSYYMP